MNNTPENSLIPGAETYAVYHFSVAASVHESLRQRVRSLGEFRDIESAFDSAREAVVRDFALAHQAGESRPMMVATEFGYELRSDTRVISRFWIQTRPVVWA